MSDIIIRDANNVSQVIRTFSDATSVHNNASVPINVSGLPIFVTAAPGIVAGVVSVTPEGGNFPVSVAGQVSLAPQLLVVSGSVGLSGPLPAGTLHLGKVSVEGLTIGAGSGLTVSVGGAVSAQAVPMAGTDGSNYRIPLTDTGGRLIVNASLGGSTAHIGRVSVVPDAGANFPVSVAGTVNVSLGALVNNLPVSVANSNPITVSLAPSTTPIAVSAEGGFLDSVISITNVAAVSLGGGTALIGAVSISPNGLNIPTSVASTGSPNADGISFGAAHSLRVMNAGFVYNRASDTWDRLTGTSVGLQVQLWDPESNVALQTFADNSDGQATSGTANRLGVVSKSQVYNRISGTWDAMTGTSVGLDVIGKARYSSTLPTLADGAVSVLQVGSRGSLNVTLVSPDSTGTIGLTNSMADAKANNINRIPTEDYMMVYNTSGGNWDRWDGKVSVGAIAVSVPPISGGTQTVSVGGPVSVQAVQIAGRDSAGNARSPLMHTDGALVVHISAGAAAGGGGGPTVSVGGPVSVQAVPVAGEDINGIVRLLKTAIDGTLKTSSYMTSPSYAFTRPTDTVAYAAGDLVANSTVAGTVVPLSWPVARLTNTVNTFSIRRARITKSGLSITNAAYRLHIFTTATGVSVSTGDNRVFTSVWSPASKYAGAIDFIIDRPGKDGSFGDGVVANGSEINIVLTSGKTSISGLLEARGAYTPLSGETFTVGLEIFQD